MGSENHTVSPITCLPPLHLPSLPPTSPPPCSSFLPLPRSSLFILHSFHKYFQSTLSMPGSEEPARQEEGMGMGHVSGAQSCSQGPLGPSLATF